MQFILRNKNFIFVSLLIVALLPYFIICFYSLPFADDFCFGWTAAEKIPFVQKFLNQYLKWNGRYTADVLVNLHPLVTGNLFVYQLSLFTSLLATTVIVAVFVRQIIKHKTGALIISLFITIFYFNYLPNLTDGVYWYIGIANYHVGNLILLLQLIFLIKSLSSKGETKILYLLPSLLLLIISAGFNEVGAILIPAFYFCSMLFYPKSEIARQKILMFHFTVAIAASAFVIFSPGNFVRENLFADRYDFFYSFVYSSLQTIRFIADWSFSISFIALSLMAVVMADKIQNKFTLKIDYRIILAFMFFTVFIGSFLPYFATGMLGQHRTINYVFFYFIFLWVMFLVSASDRFSLYQKFIRFKDEKVVFYFLFLSILSIIFSGNTWKIIFDFRQDNFRKYKNEYYTRQSIILQNPKLPIRSLTAIPKTFQIVDAKGDTSWWVDKCMNNFYLKTKN